MRRHVCVLKIRRPKHLTQQTGFVCVLFQTSVFPRNPTLFPQNEFSYLKASLYLLMCVRRSLIKRGGWIQPRLPGGTTTQDCVYFWVRRFVEQAACWQASQQKTQTHTFTLQKPTSRRHCIFRNNCHYFQWIVVLYHSSHGYRQKDLYPHTCMTKGFLYKQSVACHSNPIVLLCTWRCGILCVGIKLLQLWYK